jgi:hypothetical protein
MCYRFHSGRSYCSLFQQSDYEISITKTEKLFENESQILHNRHRYLILDVMIFNNFTGF